MEFVTVTVMFLIAAVALSLWFRRQRVARSDELNAIASTLGLRDAADDAETAGWVDASPPFRFLASGTNKRVLGRLTGVRSGVPFEFVHYRCGSQTSSHQGEEYLIFSTMPSATNAPSFSLVPSGRLQERLARTDSTVVPMPGWTSLDDWSLWMHTDPTNPNSTTSVSAGMLTAASAHIDRGDRLRVEWLGGRFVTYERHDGAIEQLTVERLIDNGFGLLSHLS